MYLSIEETNDIIPEGQLYTNDIYIFFMAYQLLREWLGSYYEIGTIYFSILITPV